MILVRSMEAAENLPEILMSSNALTMTVPQSKGLEFDDVRTPQSVSCRLGPNHSETVHGAYC